MGNFYGDYQYTSILGGLACQPGRLEYTETVSDPIVLPAGLSLAIIAFLLALLPAGLFLWLWYLRRSDRPVLGQTVALAFGVGMALVIPAFWVEDFARSVWQSVSPSSAHYFEGALLPLLTVRDIFLPALATFLIVALTEEGLRYLVLRAWVRFHTQVDQVFDGLVLGVAAGIGFATLENTVYFLNLFQQGNFDTLVFVFFLRFLISTLAHISFGGLMGTYIAQGAFDLYRPQRFYIRAFFIPWFLHGLYDLLLSVNQSFYAVLVLLPALASLILWSGKREFFTLHRKDGRFLVQEEPPETRASRTVKRFASSFRSPWNRQAPWLAEAQARRAITRDEKEYEP